MTTLDIEGAVLAAAACFEKFYAEKGLSEALLEEVQANEMGDWEVTLGYDRRLPSGPAAAVLSGPQFVREYKTFIVDHVTGKVSSLRIRPPAKAS